MAHNGRIKGLAKDYRGIAKLSRGPGGWSCVCCSPYNKADIKPHAHRLTRRKAKQALHVEIERFVEFL